MHIQQVYTEKLKHISKREKNGNERRKKERDPRSSFFVHRVAVVVMAIYLGHGDDLYVLAMEANVAPGSGARRPKTERKENQPDGIER